MDLIPYIDSVLAIITTLFAGILWLTRRALKAIESKTDNDTDDFIKLPKGASYIGRITHIEKTKDGIKYTKTIKESA